MEPKVLALVRGHFRWRFPYLGRVHGVLDGVPRVLWDPRDPLSYVQQPRAAPAAAAVALSAGRLACAVGRGRVSLLTSADTWHPQHGMDIGHL